jgi:hypothetical protein
MMKFAVEKFGVAAAVVAIAHTATERCAVKQSQYLSSQRSAVSE